MDWSDLMSTEYEVIRVKTVFFYFVSKNKVGNFEKS